MGVVVRRYIDILIIIITFTYSTCISSFFGSSIPTFLLILKMFFKSFYVIFVQYSKRCSKNIRDHSYCTEVWMTILESGWNLWVWLVGVVSRRWVWLVGGI